MVKRGTYAKVSERSGVPYETVRRYYSGGNVGILSVEKIRTAHKELYGDNDGQPPLGGDPGNEKTDGIKTKSRKSSAKAGQS